MKSETKRISHGLRRRDSDKQTTSGDGGRELLNSKRFIKQHGRVTGAARKSAADGWCSHCRIVVWLAIVLTGAAVWIQVQRNTTPSQHSTSSPISVDVTKKSSTASVDDYQNVSLRSSFYLDWRRVTSQRERNMRLYNYSYDVNGVDKRTNLSLQEFRDVYDGKWPVIIKDVVPTWPASKWTHDSLCTLHGKERVVMKGVQEAREGGKPALSRLMALPLELFCEHVNDSSPEQWTYINDELFLPSRPYLRGDVGDSIYTEDDMFRLFPAEVRPWDAMFLWGTAYSRSTLHIDPYNWTGTNAVIRGRKRWKLFPPGQDDLLYVMPDKLSEFPLNCNKYNSIVDAFNPTYLVRYPKMAQSVFLEVDQLPGELMIIPTGWFHQVYNVEETLAISGQVTNVNNYRVVLEEILKLEENLRRSSLPHKTEFLSPRQQVELVMSRLSNDVIKRGQHVNEESLRQMRQPTKDGATIS